MVKNITANGEFYFIDPKSRNYIKELKHIWEGNDNNSNLFCIEVIGKCSEIIKDEELAKRVIGNTEAFASLLQANDIWLENPYGNDPCVERHGKTKPTYCFDSCQGSCWDLEVDYEEWEQAQQKVGDWLVIKKV